MLDRSALTEQVPTREFGRGSRLQAAFQRFGVNRQALVIAHDVAIAVLALPIAFMLRENELLLESRYVDYIISTIPFLAICALVATLLFCSHRAVWRYLDIPEIIRLAQMVLFTVVVFQLGQFFIDRLEGMPRSGPPLQFLIMLFLMLASRIAYGAVLRRTESSAAALASPSC